MKLINVTNHTLNQEQIEDAKRLGVTEFIELPDNLKAIWSNIPADEDIKGVDKHLKPLIEFLANEIKKDDLVLVQGEHTATFLTINYVYNLFGKAVAATSKREVIEVINEDGSVSKKSIFKHVRFRFYFEN